MTRQARCWFTFHVFVPFEMDRRAHEALVITGSWKQAHSVRGLNIVFFWKVSKVFGGIKSRDSAHLA